MLEGAAGIGVCFFEPGVNLFYALAGFGFIYFNFFLSCHCLHQAKFPKLVLVCL